MSTPERDEHFRGFAKQQFDDVEGMFIKWFCATEPEEEARIAHDIQLYLARRAYDLACHVADELLGGSNPEYFIARTPPSPPLSPPPPPPTPPPPPPPPPPPHTHPTPPTPPPPPSPPP